MHPGIQALIQKYGVPVSERSCNNSYIWDGKTLALNIQEENWDEDYNNLLSLSDPLPIDDSTLLHEIGHWLAAIETEREFPEYGCTLGIVFHVANGGLSWMNVKYGTQEFKALEDRVEGVLSREEQNFREICADLFGEYHCDRLGIRVQGGDKGRCTYKLINSFNYSETTGYSYEVGWKAIIWLREHNLIA